MNGLRRSLASCQGQPSGTKALLTFMTVVIGVRVMLAGVSVPGFFTVANEIDGTGYALILGSLGGIYWGRHGRSGAAGEASKHD